MPPGWDGIETISRIWKIAPELQVVVCTSYSDYTWEEMRAKVGQPDGLLVLKKPFDNVEVQQLAHALTKKWQLNLQAGMQLTELAKAEERFSKAFHESPLPSGIQSLPEQRFLDVNQRMAEVAGFEREEMIGRTPAELNLWDNPATAADWYAKLRGGEQLRDLEAKIRSKLGPPKEVRISLSHTSLGGHDHALLLVQDVSERVLLERELRQAQKMEVVGQLAAGVAHDFNNILTIIQGHASLLHARQTAPAQDTKSIEQIALAAGRAATLVRQLLMFSRKQVMQFKHVDLNELIRNATKMLERLVGEHVEIQFVAHESLPSIYADVSMLEQIVMNLAVNARDAMPSGGQVFIQTSVETLQGVTGLLENKPRNGHFVCLSFRDTGTGMDSQVMARIFEPFFTTKPPGKGTGLGLSTVYGIVQQHQGWLEVASEPGKGTVFKVYFPAGKQAAEKVQLAVDGALIRGQETVLVAEDEEPLRHMVAQALRQETELP